MIHYVYQHQCALWIKHWLSTHLALSINGLCLRISLYHICSYFIQCVVTVYNVWSRVAVFDLLPYKSDESILVNGRSFPSSMPHFMSMPVKIKRGVQCRPYDVQLLVMLLKNIINSYSASHDNWCTVGEDGGCRVGEVQASTTSPMPDHKGFKLQ